MHAPGVPRGSGGPRVCLLTPSTGLEPVRGTSSEAAVPWCSRARRWLQEVKCRSRVLHSHAGVSLASGPGHTHAGAQVPSECSPLGTSSGCSDLLTSSHFPSLAWVRVGPNSPPGQLSRTQSGGLLWGTGSSCDFWTRSWRVLFSQEAFGGTDGQEAAQ